MSNTFNEDQILAKTQSVVLEYSEKGDSMPIEDLLKLQDRLSGYLFFLGSQYTDAYAKNLNAYTDKKMKITKVFLSKKAEKLDGEKGVSDKLAEQMAIELTGEELKTEIENDIRAQRLKISIDRGDKVLGSIAQRISHLKIERRETKNSTSA